MPETIDEMRTKQRAAIIARLADLFAFALIREFTDLEVRLQIISASVSANDEVH